MNTKKDVRPTDSEMRAIALIKKYLDEHGFNYEIYRTPKEVDLDFLNYKTWFLGNGTNCMDYRQFIRVRTSVEEAKDRKKINKANDILRGLANK